MNPPATSSTFWSLHRKIAAFCIFIGIAATTVSTAFAWWLYTGKLEELSRARLESTRSLLAQNLSDELARLKNETGRLASSPLITTVLEELRTNPASPNAAALLKTAIQGSAYTGVYLYHPDGSLAAREGGSLDVSKDPGPLKNLLQSLADRPDPRTEVHMPGDSITSQVLFHAAAIRVPQGNPAAYLVVESPIQQIFNLLTPGSRTGEIGLGETGEAFLVDAQGRARTPVRSGAPRIESPGARTAGGGETGSAAYTNHAGSAVLGAYTRIPGGLDWTLVVEQSRTEALARAGSVKWMLGGVAALVAVLVLGLGYGFANYVTGPIAGIQETLKRINAGDDSARAPVASGDEFGALAANFNKMIEERNAARDRIATENRRLQNNIQDFLLVVADASEGRLAVRARKTEGLLGNVAEALNLMLHNVGILIGEAKRASAQVEGAAGGISEYAQELTLGATRQTDQVTQTIGDVETLASESRNVSDNSREAAQAAARTKEAAESGAGAVKDTITFMEQLRQGVQATAQAIIELGERSHEISGIVQSISEISAETDVLAMNASIEAARAGEQGRGFTIVADQVRALADRVRLATVEIEKLVHRIQNETADAVRQMEHQTREVDNGVRQVASAGQALGRIVETSVDSSTLAGQISDSASEQEKRARAVLNAVLAVNHIAEETRARTVEFQQTSDQLALLAIDLNKQLANFEVGDTATEPQA